MNILHYAKPWDDAAGLCIIREAGGVMTDLNGEIHVETLNAHMVATCAGVYHAFCDLIKD